MLRTSIETAWERAIAVTHQDIILNICQEVLLSASSSFLPVEGLSIDNDISAHNTKRKLVGNRVAILP